MTQDFMAANPLPWYYRWFPSRHVEAAMPEWAGHGDVVYVSVRTRLSWADRIRALATGRLRTEVRVTIEHRAGRTVSAAETWVEWPDAQA